MQYDYSAIERDIAEAFGIGKPEITNTTEIPQVIWNTGVTSLRTKMRALRKSKTLVQVRLLLCIEKKFHNFTYFIVAGTTFTSGKV